MLFSLLQSTSVQYNIHKQIIINVKIIDFQGKLSDDQTKKHFFVVCMYFVCTLTRAMHHHQKKISSQSNYTSLFFQPHACASHWTFFCPTSHLIFTHQSPPRLLLSHRQLINYLLSSAKVPWLEILTTGARKKFKIHNLGGKKKESANFPWRQRWRSETVHMDHDPRAVWVWVWVWDP